MEIILLVALYGLTLEKKYLMIFLSEDVELNSLAFSAEVKACRRKYSENDMDLGKQDTTMYI